MRTLPINCLTNALAPQYWALLQPQSCGRREHSTNALSRRRPSVATLVCRVEAMLLTGHLLDEGIGSWPAKSVLGKQAAARRRGQVFRPTLARSRTVPNTVLEAIKMGLWDFEPEETQREDFEACGAMPGTPTK